jgi:hypothetical protein
MSAEPHADTVEDVVDEEFVALDGDVLVGEAIEQFRAFVPEDDETTIYYVYVRGNDDRTRDRRFCCARFSLYYRLCRRLRHPMADA